MVKFNMATLLHQTQTLQQKKRQHTAHFQISLDPGDIFSFCWRKWDYLVLWDMNCSMGTMPLTTSLVLKPTNSKKNNKNKKSTNSVVGGLFTWHPISALTLEIGSKLGFRNFTGNCLEFISSLRERLAIERKGSFCSEGEDSTSNSVSSRVGLSHQQSWRSKSSQGQTWKLRATRYQLSGLMQL